VNLLREIVERGNVGLLRGEIGSLPDADLNDEIEQAMLRRWRC